ncbi:EcsC family protein [Paenibacillus sp. L3-i20]|uniref:EcsC family protein n=1 Tax=Paenibacillus sp. L3-i20 TaxID=2905833 RepID=UPI001EDEC046|nr:EcsC family protein [Paenibacillus sp. L3-i20]GKU76598.1 ABC transporter-associated protein EcsC [Paenibacillus sp. L3-i20]
MRYEEKILQELEDWEHSFYKTPGLLENASKKVGNKINSIVPAKVQNTITGTVKVIVRTTLFGAEYTPKRTVESSLTLEQADDLARQVISLYQKIATAEGAGTGAGGILFSAVDFPALIAIKMKMLFELAHVYGYSTKTFSERIFILTLFQLTYSENKKRRQILIQIRDWNKEKIQWSSDSEYYKELNWENFQKEYRDAIDFRKMLQMVPGIGAVAGAWANYSIVEELGKFAINSFRTRRLSDNANSSTAWL